MHKPSSWHGHHASSWKGGKVYITRTREYNRCTHVLVGFGSIQQDATSAIVLLAHSQNKSGIFAFPPFGFAFESSCLFSEHLADCAAFNAASSATKILLNHSSGLFLSFLRNAMNFVSFF